MKKIILISAKAQHGKDTFAELLKNKLESKGNKIVVDHFAKYIKNFLKNYYKWDGVTKDEFTRSKLQILGTERIKEDLNYKCFHAKRLTEDFQIVQDDFDYFLVPDTRFPDEIYLFKAMFPEQVTTVRIYRDGVIGELTKEQLKHKSEIALDEFSFDWIVNNNGTLEDLEKEVELFIQYLNL
jgi:phosphomevalonate kinase